MAKFVPEVHSVYIKVGRLDHLGSAARRDSGTTVLSVKNINPQRRTVTLYVYSLEFMMFLALPCL
jgi:hypothetical protein